MLNAATISGIASELERCGLSEQEVAALRASYPKMHFTYCMDDDVGFHEPYSKYRGFNIYLVDGRAHCLKITKEIAHATGLLLAEVIEDDQS